MHFSTPRFQFPQLVKKNRLCAWLNHRHPVPDHVERHLLLDEGIDHQVAGEGEAERGAVGRGLGDGKHAGCAGSCARVAAADAVTAGDEIDLTLPLAMAAARGFRIVDIRERYECEAEPMPIAEHESVPMGQLLGGGLQIDASSKYLLVCAHGVRSRAAAVALRALGRENVWSLRGGLAAGG